MSGRLIILVAVIAGFSVLSAVAIMDAGYIGVLMSSFQNWSGAQIFTDLAIMCVLACIWMVIDARERGLSAWPFIVITLAAGSFGPLLYLVTRELRGKGGRPASA
jgi:hypothetical protein